MENSYKFFFSFPYGQLLVSICCEADLTHRVNLVQVMLPCKFTKSEMYPKISAFKILDVSITAAPLCHISKHTGSNVILMFTRNSKEESTTASMQNLPRLHCHASQNQGISTPSFIRAKTIRWSSGATSNPYK